MKIANYPILEQNDDYFNIPAITNFKVHEIDQNRYFSETQNQSFLKSYNRLKPRSELTKKRTKNYFRSQR